MLSSSPLYIYHHNNARVVRALSDLPPQGWMRRSDDFGPPSDIPISRVRRLRRGGGRNPPTSTHPPEKGRGRCHSNAGEMPKTRFRGPSPPRPVGRRGGPLFAGSLARRRRGCGGAPCTAGPPPPPAGPGSSAVPAGSTRFPSETCDIIRMEYYFLTTI